MLSINDARAAMKSSVIENPVARTGESAAALLEARALCRDDAKSGRTLLDHAGIALHDGDQAVISGPSGSGKSLFLRALALLDAAVGEVFFHGMRIAGRDVPAFRSKVIYLGQRPALFEGSVEDNLRLPFELEQHRGRRYDAAVIAQLLDRCGVARAFTGRSARELSGGEAQLLSLFRALQLDPEVLLLDEASSALDPDSAQRVESLLQERMARRTQPRASVWITHDAAQACRIGNRHLAMREGRLTETSERSGRLAHAELAS
jgi:putative ABC transport system ATP-binding protein